MNNSFDELERQLRDSAPALPPELRSRVLNSCAAKRQKEAQRNWRANWRLSYAFAAVLLMHWLVGGYLENQRAELLGTNSSPIVASRPPDPARVQLALQMRAQTLAALNNSNPQPF